MPKEDIPAQRKPATRQPPNRPIMAADKRLPTQGRDAPAYQEFAATTMARMAYRQMTLAERGLLYTLRNECWVNRRIPSDPAKLARVLGFPVEDIRESLPGVIDSFEIQGENLTCPELESYREYQDARRERMSEGGKKSAANRSGTKRDLNTVGNPASTLQAPSKLLEGSLQPPLETPATSLQALRPDKSKPEKQRTVTKEVSPHDEWLRDLERAETTSALDYARASRGS